MSPAEEQGETRVQAANRPAPEIKLLAIGNSFTGDATTYLTKLAQGGGKRLHLSRATVGGYTLQEHVKRLQAYEACPQDPRGRPYANARCSLRELLETQTWDIVTLQQSSVQSLRPETFQPSLGSLVNYIHKYAPHAKVLLAETWAYPDDYYVRVPALRLDRRSMHTQVKASYQTVSEATGLPVIPVGDAFESVSSLKHPIRLTKPGDKHCNNQGKYLAGAIFYEVIFRDSVEGNSFVPPNVSPAEAKLLLKVAHETVASPPLRAEVVTPDRTAKSIKGHTPLQARPPASEPGNDNQERDNSSDQD